eukprot:GEMP01100215.1.p1 GENE.GEMP01100215.1~~GEMP01100215.1.p1  ORF type:complete len:148 (+),score=25.78 GEMP01100215.1:243-686(+)
MCNMIYSYFARLSFLFSENKYKNKKTYEHTHHDLYIDTSSVEDDVRMLQSDDSIDDDEMCCEVPVEDAHFQRPHASMHMHAIATITERPHSPRPPFACRYKERRERLCADLPEWLLRHLIIEGRSMEKVLKGERNPRVFGHARNMAS